MMGLYNKLKEVDNKLIKMFVDDINMSSQSIPIRYLSVFCRVAGASELSYVIQKIFLNDVTDPKVLVVGLHGGRDYWMSVSRGWDVHGMDINEYDFPNTTVANAEERWPYDDKCFDVIIMGEVLEHLFFDKEALQEAGRVIKPGGKLIVTVPFLDSNDEFHVRMHDQKTIVHLLKFSGFSVVDMVERPGIYFKPMLNYVNSFLSVLVFLVFRVNLYYRLVPLYGKIEYYFGKKKILRGFSKMFAGVNYGGNILAVKSNISSDYIKENKHKFKE